MDNSQKSKVRIGLRVAMGGFFALAGIVYAGVQLPFYNNFNPFYNLYFPLALGVGLYFASTRLKSIKTIWNTLAFFNSAGLTRVFDIEAKDIHPIYLDYTDSDGHRRSIKHSHPIVIPSEDGFEQVFLVPDTGMESINPLKMIQKYGVNLKVNKTQIAQANKAIKTFNDAIADIEDLNLQPVEALNPEFLTRDMTETEDADTIFQEFKEHVASIASWSKAKALLRENLFLFIMVGVAGFAIATTVFMVTGADFRTVLHGP